jgi:lipopolysaccharide/colanic/teichoic acid biosynthesis glycosyltransferase
MKTSFSQAAPNEDDMTSTGTISPQEPLSFNQNHRFSNTRHAIRNASENTEIDIAASRKTGGTFAKRMIDYAIGSTAIVLCAPLFLAIAVAVKLDSPGPVFFRQPRRGLNGELFNLLKFRSMQIHLSDVSASRQTSRNDPRVTRAGSWLRRLSLDELPQLWNVMRGEMSLVGPRPHTPNTRIAGEILPAVFSDYMLRYRVKPGITGWAQVNDFDYIQNWSIGFDLKIMVLTVWREIISKHAF